MRLRTTTLVTVALLTLGGRAALATGIGDVKHVLILMMENRTFDEFLGQLGTKGYYQRPSATGCDYSTGANCTNDEVDGLDCSLNNASGYVCSNSNPKAFGPDWPSASCAPDTAAGVATVHHEESYCTGDTDHEWDGTHFEFNHCDPTGTIGLNDGFYVQNIRTGSLGNVLDPARALGFYDDTDLPFYYSLASAFAIGDRYFCSILGPTIPNRMYLMAATSFGHIHTGADLIPPPGGYTPTTSTIFDRLDDAGVSWKNYYHDLAQAGLFKTPEPVHFSQINQLFVDLAGSSDGQNPGDLPAVAFIDPPFTQPQPEVPDSHLNVLASDEHPPKNIQNGQQMVSKIVHALMASPHWQDTVLFINYDEHGGFYDHVPPPAAPDPDGILPGDCPDETNGFLGMPSFPATCDGPEHDPALKVPFDRLGIRVPFYVVSPFAKRHYVSHTVLDHTSLLAFLEQRYTLAPLTARDANANVPLDMFDFDNPDPTVPVLRDAGIDPAKATDPHCYEGVEVF